MRNIRKLANAQLTQTKEAIWCFVKSKLSSTKVRAVQAYSKAWFFFERFNFAVMNKLEGNKRIALFILLISVVGFSGYLVFEFQDNITQTLTGDRVKSIQQILLALGAAFIGATAITFSLVMFAMQVNVEKMPHGLFRRFSSDNRLLTVFLLSFIMAAMIISAAVVDKKEWIPGILMTSVWLSVFILFSFLYTYKRALDLISPTRQLVFIKLDLDRYFRKTDKRANLAAPLLSVDHPQDEYSSTHDMARLLYYKVNLGWHAPVLKAILHCINYSRRYAEQGDHEVSSHSLRSLVLINAAYIQHKGKTFFADNPLISNPESSDPVFSETLEHLRQNAEIAASRGDELLLQTTFRTFAELSSLYYSIDYSIDHPTKSHGRLAIGYLSGAIDLTLSHQMVDVCMNGVRMLGGLGVDVISYEDYEYLPTLTEKVALLSMISSVNKKFDPVTVVGIEQMAKITFELVRGGRFDMSFPVQEIRGDLKSIISCVLQEKESNFFKPHNYKLSGYYTSTSPSGLSSMLVQLVNALSPLDENNEDGHRIIRNLGKWSNQIYSHDKAVLLLAVAKKSHFTFDIINWITTTAETLMTATNMQCCGEHHRAELRKNAKWLINVLDWLPDSQEEVRFVENYQLTENLFRFAKKAQRFECPEIFKCTQDILLKWTIKAGKYQTGWGSLESGIQALVVLSIDEHGCSTVFESKLQAAISGANILEQILYSTAEKLRETANNNHGRHFEHSAIKRAMRRIEQDTLNSTLITVADILCHTHQNKPTPNKES
jgi:hypothetical protein